MAADTAPDCVFTAWWCCSVGTMWTVELRAADRTVPGRPLEWICSGIPTEQSTSEEHITDLLRKHDLLLFPDHPVEPRSRSRRLIGYVTRDPDVMRLALKLRHSFEDDGEHPLLRAARRIHAKRSAHIRFTTDFSPSIDFSSSVLAPTVRCSHGGHPPLPVPTS